MRNANSMSLSLLSLMKMCGALLVAGATTMIHAATLPQPVPLRAPSLPRAIVIESFAPQETNLGKRAKGKSSSSSSDGKAPTDSRNSPTRTTGDQSRGISSSRSNRLPRTSRLPVTFLTNAPETQVFLSGRSIGHSKKDSRLTVYLKRGTYTVATKQQNGSMTPAQSINVAPGNTDFNLSANATATMNPGAKSGTASGNADNAAVRINTGAKEETGSGNTDNAGVKLNPEAKEGEGAGTAEEILQRYSDPKQTGSVTESDWLRVLSLSNANLAQDPTNARFKAQAFYAQGQLSFIRGDFAGARSAFNIAALSLPDSPLAFYGLGNAYLATNQPAEAIRAYQRVLELDPEFALAHKGMGDALTRQGKHKEALGSYERSRELGYSSPDTSYNTALNLMKRKLWDAALKELHELAKTKPSADIYQSIGDCYLNLKKPLSAAQSYRKATELDPKSALAAYKYGNIMYALNEYEAAAEFLERALTLDQTGAIINRQHARKMADEAARRAHKVK